MGEPANVKFCSCSSYIYIYIYSETETVSIPAFAQRVLQQGGALFNSPRPRPKRSEVRGSLPSDPHALSRLSRVKLCKTRVALDGTSTPWFSQPCSGSPLPCPILPQKPPRLAARTSQLFATSRNGSKPRKRSPPFRRRPSKTHLRLHRTRALRLRHDSSASTGAYHGSCGLRAHCCADSLGQSELERVCGLCAILRPSGS